MKNRFDYDVISIPGGPVGYDWLPEYASRLARFKEAPIIISGSKIQTDYLESELFEKGVGEDLVINETELLSKYNLDEALTTIQNAYNTKRLMQAMDLGKKIAVVRADYHERVPGEFKLIFGPGYEIIDHPVRTTISQIVKVLRMGHEKVGILQNKAFYWTHEPRDDIGIYNIDRRIDPIMKKLQRIEGGLFGLAELVSRLSKFKE